MTQQDYWKKADESTEQYNARIAGLRGETTPATQPTTSKSTADVLAESTRVAQEAAKMIGTTFTPGYSTTAISTASTTQPPELPTPQAPTIQEQYTTSMSADLERQRKQLEDAYKQQQEEYKKQAEQAQAKIDQLTTQYKDTLEQAKPLTEPFREQLETSERQRLSVEENYFANQTLVNELDSLLTEGNQIIQQQKGITGLASIREPRISKTIDDINARVGVIEAVMNARNGQISQAYTLIDRTVSAITADRQDKLNYFNTLLSFYDTQKDEEGKKLLTLTSEQKKYAEAQIGLLETDLSTAQKNADAIKQAMTDPDMAMTYAQAGITLNDSPQQVNEKLANYAYTKEIADTSNKMSLNGYTFLAPGQSTPTGYEVAETTDSKGNVKRWAKKKELKETSTDNKAAQPLSLNQIEQFRRSYGWTPPYGFTESQLLQFMNDNPNATPEELEAGAKQALGSVGGGINQQTTEPQTTYVEAVGEIMNSLADNEMDILFKKAKEKGMTSFWKSKWNDVKSFIEAHKDTIEEAISQGATAEEIKQALLG